MAKPNISLLGATYSGVAGVTLPKSGGGTATFLTTSLFLGSVTLTFLRLLTRAPSTRIKSFISASFPLAGRFQIISKMFEHLPLQERQRTKRPLPMLIISL